ncbi:hypothetical protein Zmor_015242 [Zophobas morio]|uniref:Replication factor C subunit 1 n=1 Tax=Zophobas morio TaxID=2755281 RepID=A0AA38IM43_9CUCU|nr:hypothetical protein Zmor_015242 [Zophobas morio]
MSRDIRSFVTVISKKSGTDLSKNTAPAAKKKPKRLIDSDDEDVIAGTPDSKHPKVQEKKRKTVILSDSEDDKSAQKASKGGTKTNASKTQTKALSSDSENEKPKKSASKETKKNAVKTKKREILSSDSEDEAFRKASKEPEKKKTEEVKLKPANIADIFKNTPIKQSKVEPPKTPSVEKVVKEEKKPKRKKGKVKEEEKKVHNDDDFSKTLDDLDDDFFENNIDALEQSVSEAIQHNEKEKKENVEETQNGDDKNTRKRSRTESPEKKTPKKKKIEHVDSGIDPGQEAHEKKRYSAMLYQKYLNRSGPRHHGLKELPKGKPDCLKNLCFLRTGVLDSLESEEFDTLIKDHGGRTVQAVSKKVNYVVVGEDPGPAKLAKAESYKIPTISEDELLDMILTKSGMEAKYCKKNNSGSDEGLGLETDQESSSEKQNEDTHKLEETKTNEKTKETKQIEKDKTKEPLKEKTKKSPPVEKEKTKEPLKIKEPKKSSDEETSTKKVSSFYGSASTSTSTATAKPETNEKLSPVEKDPSLLPLTEKYKPQNLKAVIGQQGDKSNLHKLKQWLENWHKNQSPQVKKSLVRPSPWAKCDDGAYFKCALLSGPPGVGKTTSATLVAKELGLDIVEFNASDTRSKRSLKEEVAQLLHNKTIAGFATGQTKLTNNRVLLMDEVDGMAGNEDRGGMQELIQLIKNSSVPIICMCNDRNHQKIRSLVNYCFDLRFTKPRLEQIRGAMMSICFKENIDISPQALSEIIAGTGCDVRQTLNHLSVLGSTKEKITSEIAEKEAKSSKKDTIMGPWEVCRTVFTKSEHKDMSVADKGRLFFYDYSLGPLFVHENYLKVQPDKADKKQTLLKAALAAHSLSTGDIVDAKMRKSNNWALLESQSFFASVIPGHHMSGTFTSQINFPSWLGKNSKKGKFSRMLNEVQMHLRTSASASKMAVKLDYLVPLRDAILSPLQKKGMDGINEAVSVMKEYNLLRDDVDNLVELYSWLSKENPMNKIESKVKSAFTRAYNKQVTLLPYAPMSAVAKKKAAAVDADLLGEEEEVVSDNENEDDITNNAMIKVKKPTAKGKKTDEEPSTSKKTKAKKGGGKKK